MIDHITFHVHQSIIDGGDHGPGDLLAHFWADLGFTEITPDDPFEHGFDVRWFNAVPGLHGVVKPVIHCVASSQPPRAGTDLGHIAILLPPIVYDAVREGRFCQRDSGSGRAWVGLDTIRVEIRPIQKVTKKPREEQPGYIHRESRA
jgi:hypothetical protein